MILWRALQRWVRGDGLMFSGYLAFLSLLAVLPALAVLFWVSQQSELLRLAEASLREFFFQNLVPEAAQQWTQTLNKLRGNARGLGQLGVAILVIDMLAKTLAIHQAFDRIARLPSRSLSGHLRGGLVLLLLTPAVVGLVYWALRWLERLMMQFLPAWRRMIDAAFDPITVGLPLLLGLYLVYRGVPGRSAPRRVALASALVITVLLEIARYLISHHLAQATLLKSLYGAFLVVPIIMVSAIVTWALVLLGCALCAEGFGAKRARRRSSPSL